MLTEELNQVKSTNENLTKTLEDSQNQNKVHKYTCYSFKYFFCSTEKVFCMKSHTGLFQQSLSVKLEEKENELGSEKKNALKRDKTIQGLTQVLGKKEKEVRKKNNIWNQLYFRMIETTTVN